MWLVTTVELPFTIHVPNPHHSRKSSQTARRRWAVNLMCLMLVISFFICRFPICLRNHFYFLNQGKVEALKLSLFLPWPAPTAPHPLSSIIFISASCDNFINATDPAVTGFYKFADILYMLDATLFPIIIQTVFNSCFRAALLSIIWYPIAHLCRKQLKKMNRRASSGERRSQRGSIISMSTSVSTIAFSETNIDQEIQVDDVHGQYRCVQ